MAKIATLAAPAPFERERAIRDPIRGTEFRSGRHAIDQLGDRRQRARL
jgi:hypothetical protein